MPMAPIMNDMTVPATPTAPTMPTAPTASVEPAGTTPALDCRQAPSTGGPNPAPPSLDFDAVVRTHDALSAVLPETPAWSYPLLTMAAGVDVVVKHENVQPTGAFKVRGGVALMGGSPPGRAGDRRRTDERPGPQDLRGSRPGRPSDR